MSEGEILPPQAPDGHGHPAILVAVIVYAAVLTDFPAHRHAFKYVVFENQVAGITAFGKVTIFVERFRTHSVMDNVILDGFQREIMLRNGGETFYPLFNAEGFSRHGH